MRKRPVLAVFVKAPVAGRVKTRLAAEVGIHAAAEIYRTLGRDVVSTCVDRAYDTVVWFAPRRALRAVTAWLTGPSVTAFRPQIEGTLGARLTAAFDVHFREGASRVIVIGSDCPDIDSSVVSAALAALDLFDLVLGPANDGGYYLIGLRRTAPSLFDDIEWSTSAVADQTLERARRLGFSLALLPTLRDVDTAGDARALGILPRRE